MSVGAWEPQVGGPQNETKEGFNREQLLRLITIAESDTPFIESVKNEDKQASKLIRLPSQRWIDESDNWSSDQIWQLIRFFTQAEMKLPGWDAGAESAVIPLSKVLRQRSVPLTKDQLLWIRQHSNNRYLPYGPL
ncbi:hypothetical protein MO867_02675 [Microbulbifer sp. OS29]|uniref:Uncharacterized protein n=1 Tax=Microbulbifer okhotskensis TaxID=2926617 RepID=A0A9X2EKA8_9GAMM|nr:hypothetical protein [Microbulbifer okhotskensis]MCO1333236.1 hypothetical protein [Microbulbifer okhotskensis]